MQIVKVLTVLLGLAGLLGCGKTVSPRGEANQRPNVLLVSIDTLRADHLGCYGYPRPTSPAIDAFRGDSVLFAQAIAQAPSTLHSHASIFTSLLPFHHQASWGARTRLPEEIITITESLKEAGYVTAAFTGGGQMDSVFGLAQGFDLYTNPGAQTFLDTVAKGTEWLKDRSQKRPEPFFLFLHSYEPHHPYEPPAEFLQLFKDPDYDGPLPDRIDVELLREINQDKITIDEQDLAHVVNTYDAEIRSMDTAFSLLIEFLQETDLYDETLIVFTSDHGEEFGEHGRVGWHSHTLFDELLRVPLIVKYPGRKLAGAQVQVQTRSLDIAPTILAELGLEAPEQFMGIDLTPLASGHIPDDELAAVSRMDRRPGRDIASIRSPRWKLYRGQLFDLQQDAEERWDTAMNHPLEVKELEQRLEGAIAARKRWETEQVVPTEKTLDELKALGYLE